MNDDKAVSMQLRQPRLAELVAAELRDQIMRGELHDGDLLPKQEELLATFGVSKPSLREALRILETEGLVTVRRGNIGGATVHRPKASNTAYMLALVLEVRGVDLGDVSSAREVLEPQCALLCAERPDRADEVVPRLQALQDEAAASVDDEATFTKVCLEFHREIVNLCANQTLIAMVGMLESVYTQSVAEQHLAKSAAAETFNVDYRKATLDAHQQLIDAIAAGDGDLVQKVMRTHLQVQVGKRAETSKIDPTQPVRAAALHRSDN